MAEKLPSKSENKRRERQPISIPFIWEEKPGTPKKDWKPNARQTNPHPPPVKLVVSVPFGWEEKPGTPLQSFTQPPTEHDIIIPSPKQYSDHEYKNCDHQFERKGHGLSSDSESDTCSFKTVDSFTSARSTSSLVGASFLEWLFPLLATNSKFGDKDGCLEKDPSRKEDVGDKAFVHENNCSTARRPLLTLGELIVMSRRRSCQRRVNRMHKQPPMDFMKRNACDCFIFGSGNGFRGLQMKWKRQLQLKLL